MDSQSQVHPTLDPPTSTQTNPNSKVHPTLHPSQSHPNLARAILELTDNMQLYVEGLRTPYQLDAFKEVTGGQQGSDYIQEEASAGASGSGYMSD
jgi:hypothetical protein